MGPTATHRGVSMSPHVSHFSHWDGCVLPLLHCHLYHIVSYVLLSITWVAFSYPKCPTSVSWPLCASFQVSPCNLIKQLCMVLGVIFSFQLYHCCSLMLICIFPLFQLQNTGMAPCHFNVLVPLTGVAIMVSSVLLLLTVMYLCHSYCPIDTNLGDCVLSQIFYNQLLK